MAVDLGKISITPKGVHSSSNIYEILDVVTSNGNSYLSLRDGNSEPLNNTDNWQLIAQKGDTGAQGPPGEDYIPLYNDDFTI